MPRKYGGQGSSLLDVVIASEEICAVDPGFGCTLLCNALGYLPVLWFGSEKQKDCALRAATSDEPGEYIAGYIVSEPPGTPGGTANFDCPLPRPAGLGITAARHLNPLPEGIATGQSAIHARETRLCRSW